jgi:muramoyltetrapeptide carboxypeptidase
MPGILPPPLTRGSKIAIINTGRECRSDLDQVRQLIQKKEWQAVSGKSISAPSFAQFACDDETRLADLQEAINNPDIHAILFVRGGYGMLRILHQLNTDALDKNPKWLIGYSDITYLLSAVQSKHGMACIHSPMAAAWEQTPEEQLQGLFTLLQGKPLHYEFQNIISSLPFEKINAQITGGNLSILHSLAAAGELPPLSGKILFIEDVFENLMSIERMLLALKYGGVFDDLAAVLLGDFSIPVKDNETSNFLFPDMEVKDDASAEKALTHLMNSFFAGSSFPVLKYIPVGHKPGRNFPIPLGLPVSLQMQNQNLILQTH